MQGVIKRPPATAATGRVESEDQRIKKNRLAFASNENDDLGKTLAWKVAQGT